MGRKTHSPIVHRVCSHENRRLHSRYSHRDAAFTTTHTLGHWQSSKSCVQRGVPKLRTAWRS